ncbi:ribosomal protein S9/S16-domain-containing protein [Roridomyces roridus]|uniref:Ribosomal protein S9/S16-domain-containing protein n=1 Tax=Roridomyces roridus TaxID=1738132 RepID=A0AAD7FZ34_9AGAR|nr:ribosomal protein S9/S16-domain-containing protein [Roridomyces roridus]
MQAQRLLRSGLATLCRHAITRAPQRAFASRPPFVPPVQQIGGGSSLPRWQGERVMEDDLEEFFEEDDEAAIALEDEEVTRAMEEAADAFAMQEQEEGIEGEVEGSEALEESEEQEEEEDDEDEEFEFEEDPTLTGKQPPTSPNFYSGRAAYYDQLAQIESAVAHTRSALRMLQLLPLPAFARQSLPTRPAIWKTAKEMGDDLGIPMTSGRYRTLTRLLVQMNEYLVIATAAGCDELAERAKHLLNLFESSTKQANLTRGRKKVINVDHLGRSYTFGKRKTSTARVWMVPVATPSEKLDVIDLEMIDSLDEAEALMTSQPERFHQPQLVPQTAILINNIPLGEYFPIPADRERAVRPLKIAGMFSAYNIFSLVRGGGTTGQSGALAHGISKGLLVHNPDLGTVLRRTKLLRRDPRMVERKKTGKAKARKGYTWVKR